MILRNLSNRVTIQKDDPLAKPNYNFAKRQRELAKKAKKEEKQQRKSVEGSSTDAETTAPDTTIADESPPPPDTLVPGR